MKRNAMIAAAAVLALGTIGTVTSAFAAPPSQDGRGRAGMGATTQVSGGGAVSMNRSSGSFNRTPSAYTRTSLNRGSRTGSWDRGDFRRHHRFSRGFGPSIGVGFGFADYGYDYGYPGYGYAYAPGYAAVGYGGCGCGAPAYAYGYGPGWGYGWGGPAISVGFGFGGWGWGGHHHHHWR